MKLSDLLKDVAAPCGFEADIAAITCDSRKVVPGCLYICIKGVVADGHDYAASAMENGAAAVVCQRDLGLERQILVPDSRKAYALICANWFGNPARKLRLIGVTGTNGKTSTVGLIRQILEQNGHKTGFIGTVGALIGDRRRELTHTTPDAFLLQEIFADMAQSGCTFAVMEVSSHALDQERMHGCDFEVAVFTNLTQDHLDYHKTMDNYLQAKKKLFSMCQTALMNQDDPHFSALAQGQTCRVLTYSAKNASTHFFANEILSTSSGVEYLITAGANAQKAKYCTPGIFSVYNSLAAAAACFLVGLKWDEICAAMQKTVGVKGRLEVVPTGEAFDIIIDYAHTPDGLENLLHAVKGFVRGRIITVFGCGGDREREKRPQMGEIAYRLSDQCIVTSDNPRNENPQDIIDEILRGIKAIEKPLIVEPDRVKAICRAIALAKPKDVVLLAGKGHETYQIVGDRVRELDERKVALDYINRREKGEI